MSPWARLCGWRLRHLAAATFRLLARRWQAIVFLALLLSPTDMPLAEQLRIVAAPVLQMVQPGDAARAIGTWLAVLFVATSWSALQGQALAGGRGWEQLAVLPLPPRMLQAVDLAVLAVADLPLWLPFAAAIVSLGAHHGSATAAALALAAQVPVAQWLALRRSPALVACLAGSCAGFVLMAASGNAWALCAATWLGTLAGTAPGPRFPARHARSQGGPWLALPAHGHTPLQLAVIALRALFGTDALARHSGLLLTALLPPALFVFLHEGGLQPGVVSVALLLLLPALLFRVAGLALDLKRSHQPMERLHASLGMTPRLLLRIALLVLSAVFAVASLPLALTLWRASGSPGALALVPIGVAAMAAMAWLDRDGARRRFVPRAAVAALACVAVYALL